MGSGAAVVFEYEGRLRIVGFVAEDAGRTACVLHAEGAVRRDYWRCSGARGRLCFDEYGSDNAGPEQGPGSLHLRSHGAIERSEDGHGCGALRHGGQTTGEDEGR